MIAMLYVMALLVLSPPVFAERVSLPETAEELLLFSEDFERDLAAHPWHSSGDVSVITASDPLIKAAARPYFDNSSRFVRFRIGNGEAAVMELPVRVLRDAHLSFFHRVDIDGASGQRFRVLVDGKEAKVLAGLDHVWKRESVPLKPGDRILRFELVGGGVLIENHDNAVYVDTLTIAADVIHHVTVGSPGVKETRVGAPSGERLVFVPRAHRIDGSAMPVAREDFDLLVTGEDGTCFGDGIIDHQGVLTPLTPGAYRIRGALKAAPEIYGLSAGVIVRHRDFLTGEPYLYPGTGHTYQGYMGSRTDGEPLSHRSITVNFPLEREFDADGFFPLRGTVKNPACLDHARLLISRIDDGGGEMPGNGDASDVYYLHKDFDTRIWLRYGKGKYRADLYHIVNITAASRLGTDGFISRAAYNRPPGISFVINNTRDEDGSLIYPGPGIPSDDHRIMNLMNEITFGIHDEAGKIQAIHDRVVRMARYDDEAAKSDNHKAKSDALLMLRRRVGLCEDYSVLSASLLRSAGIPTQVVYDEKRDHAFNVIYQGNTPLLFDATWDDPRPGDHDEDRVTYDWLLKALDFTPPGRND
ncbi:MAG: transglutaminase domain-containing protein [Treponema sp.]|jgi:hypothetical protein|nr:transglutaminase domain-containing protein [Treponema sp.]